jgi:plastocyanin
VLHRPKLLVLLMTALLAAPTAAAARPPSRMPTRLATPSYLPDSAASRIVTITPTGEAAAAITILTEAVAIKETGPRATVARFGEVYAFAPAFIAVHRDEPTEISFWNLQPDDEHDVMLVAPGFQVLMKVVLPPLEKTTYVFTFHEEGLFALYCTMHQPAMSGQILVLPPGRSG